MTDESQTQTSAKTKTASRKSLWNYFKQCTAHSWRGIRALWPLWFGIFALVTVLVVLYLLGCREKDIRWLGMLLQLGGVMTVAKGLRDSGRLFKRPTVRDRIALYLEIFPKYRVTADSLPGAVVTVGRPVISGGRLAYLPGPDTPLDKRVEMLEEVTNQLFREVGELEGKLRAQSDDLRLKITEETTQRKAEHRTVEEQLERAVIGGIHVEWWGVFCFIVGIILASASPELAALLGNAGNCK